MFFSYSLYKDWLYEDLLQCIFINVCGSVNKSELSTSGLRNWDNLAITSINLVIKRQHDLTTYLISPFLPMQCSVNGLNSLIIEKCYSTRLFFTHHRPMSFSMSTGVLWTLAPHKTHWIKLYYTSFWLIVTFTW